MIRRLKSYTNGILDPNGLTLKVAASVIAGTLGRCVSFSLFLWPASFEQTTALNASAIANPTDLVKIRMQAYHPNGSPYKSMRHAFATIYHERLPSPASSRSTPSGTNVRRRAQGLSNLYRGVFPTVARGWAVAAFQMPAYDHTKQYLKSHGIFREGLSAHLASSLFAGYVSLYL